MSSTVLMCPVCQAEVSRNGIASKCMRCSYDFIGKPELITAEKVKDKLERNEKIILLDVRQQSEYEHAHIKNAKSIPLAQLPKRIKELDKNKEIIVYCHRGMGSYHAALFLKQKGYKTLSLEGGIDRWSMLIDGSIPRY